MQIDKEEESNKVTGDKLEGLIERAAGGPDRKRGEQSKDDDDDDSEEELDLEDTEIEDEEDE